jgi:DNA-directed RNA polymerase subunit RPC12/RpoP
MRKFKCYDCQHEFSKPYGEGGRGVNMTCPECGSKNVHRVRSGVLAGVGSWGRGFGQGRGFGGQRGGRWEDPDSSQKETDLKDGS